MFHAVEKENVEIVKLLLTKNIDINIQSKVQQNFHLKIKFQKSIIFHLIYNKIL